MNSGRHPHTHTQPTYDFLAGASSPIPSTAAGNPLRQSVRSSQPIKPDAGNEELRVQISTLRYELDNLKQERDLTALHHEKELRDLQVRADADFRKAQAAESSNNKAQHKIESLTAELKKAEQDAIDDKSESERRIRTLADKNQALEEDLEDAQSQLSDHERQYKHQIHELDAIRSSLQEAHDELRAELEETKSTLQLAQDRLSQREAEVAALETENIRLKSEGTDAETVNVLKRELSEQLSQVKRLDAELRPLRKSQKNVEVVEEQKKGLENQLQMMKGVEAELRNVQIQNQVLEDERRSWAAMLQVNGQVAELDSPEDVVRTLVQARIENASLLDRIGNVQSEVVEKNEIISNFETEKANIQTELEKVRAAAGSTTSAADTRARTRLERQRVLAVKEVEYLRAQLKTFDAEETTMNPEENRIDEQKSQHIAQLETLLSEHREELNKLHEELSKVEKKTEEDPASIPRGIKRPLSPADSDAESERIAVLIRKNRTLQDSLSKSDQSAILLKKELEATKSHLSTLQVQSRTRILELRDNPTAEAENLKLSTLTTLRAENRDLLTRLQGNKVKSVPASTLASMKLELQEMERIVAEKDKRMRRLKEIWTAKSSEFREAVASVLGYKLDFLPNGRVRVTSMFHLSPAYRHGDRNASFDSRGPGSMGDGEENSIIFDGENGTMKISGGPSSLFALEIRDLIKFWVEERKDIPCFLAAMTLDFYDKTTRAARI